MCCVHFVVSAGIDTSRITLYFVIRYMAGLPDIQKKVHEELDKVVGKQLNYTIVYLGRLRAFHLDWYFNLVEGHVET